jgi:hypothetical protein
MKFTSDFELGDHVKVRNPQEYQKTNPEGFVITRISVDYDGDGTRFHYWEQRADHSGTGWDSASLVRVHPAHCEICGHP